MKVQQIKETSHLHEQIKNLSTTLTECKIAHGKERKAFQEQIATSNETYTGLKADAIKAREELAAVFQSVQVIINRASSCLYDKDVTHGDSSTNLR